jgi:hypothetical protein
MHWAFMVVTPYRTPLYAGTPVNNSVLASCIRSYSSSSNNQDQKGNQQGSSNKQNSNDSLTEQEKYWLGGFIEGEGSWSVSFRLSGTSRLGIQVAPTFSVSQHVFGGSILYRLQQALGGIGRIVPKSGSVQHPSGKLDWPALLPSLASPKEGREAGEHS